MRIAKEVDFCECQFTDAHGRIPGNVPAFPREQEPVALTRGVLPLIGALIGGIYALTGGNRGDHVVSSFDRDGN